MLTKGVIGKKMMTRYLTGWPGLLTVKLMTTLQNKRLLSFKKIPDTHKNLKTRVREMNKCEECIRVHSESKSTKRIILTVYQPGLGYFIP